VPCTCLPAVQRMNPDGTPLPKFLHDKRVMQLDVGLLIAGAKVGAGCHISVRAALCGAVSGPLWHCALFATCVPSGPKALGPPNPSPSQASSPPTRPAPATRLPACRRSAASWSLA
jgi:hypothetical protein